MSSLIPWKRDDGNVASMTPVSRMRWDWDRLFDRFLDDFWSQPVHAGQGPLLDLTETDEEVRLRAEVPGVRPDDLDVRLAGDVLTLAGRKVDETGAKEGARTWSERTFGAFERAIQLPCPVDPDHVHAEHANGVVTITLRKAEAVRPKRIQVQTS